MITNDLARLSVGAAAAIWLTSALIVPGSAQQLTPWRNVIINPKADAGIYLMASKHGFDRKNGLKVDTIDVKDDQLALRALLSGAADSYEAPPGGAIAAAVRGADIKVLGCEWINVPLGLMVHDNISSVADLKGKSIAASAAGSMPDMLVRAALANDKVPASDVTFASVGGDLQRYDALVSGVVQAAVVSNEYVPLKSSKDLKMLVKGAEVLPSLLRTCLITTGKIASSRHDDLVRLVRAEIEGLRYAVGHRNATIKLTDEVTGAKPDDPRAGFVFDEAIKGNQVATDLPIPMHKLAWMQDEMLKLGQIPKTIDLNKIVDKSIRAEALRDIGKP